jgi:hypothetical protein
MILSSLLAAVLLFGQTPGWAWTLYEGSGPVVLANEKPDSPDLRSTLECDPGSGVARISVYASPLDAGFATVAAGDASAAVEASKSADGAVVAPLRTDHPVFGRFAASGTLSITVGQNHQTLEVPASDLAKLRRFADLCGG